MENLSSLYDLEASSSDRSESSHEAAEDSDTKKRRIEDKLWEEAILANASDHDEGLPEVNEEFNLVDSSKSDGFSSAQGGNF